MDVVETIRDSGQIRGLVVLFSSNYKGNDEYKEFLLESIREKDFPSEGRYRITYKSALTQFLEMINAYPMPIVCGLSGDIGPDSFGLGLALDIRIATHTTRFINPNLQIGFPPSPLLAFY